MLEQIRAEVFDADILEIAELRLELLRASGLGGELLDNVPENCLLVDCWRTPAADMPGIASRCN